MASPYSQYRHNNAQNLPHPSNPCSAQCDASYCRDVNRPLLPPKTSLHVNLARSCRQTWYLLASRNTICVNIHSEPPTPSTSQLTKTDGVSTVPTMVRGDWVLFHPVYTPKEMRAVEVRTIAYDYPNIYLNFIKVLHRDAKTISDKLAYGFVRFARFACFVHGAFWLFIRLRFGFDLVSRYKHKKIPPGSTMTLEELRKEGYLLDEQQWLNVSGQRVKIRSSIDNLHSAFCSLKQSRVFLEWLLPLCAISRVCG